MKKQILSLVLAFAFAFGMLPLLSSGTAQAIAPKAEILIAPRFDGTVSMSGFAATFVGAADEVTIDVYAKINANVDTISFPLTLSAGLTYVSKSVVINPALHDMLETFGSEDTSLLGDISFTPSKMLFLANTADLDGFPHTGTNDLGAYTLLFSFRCTVDTAAVADYSVTVNKTSDDFVIGYDGADLSPVSVQDATVSVTEHKPTYLGFQYSELSGGTCDLRFVIGVPALNYVNVGFEVKAVDETGVTLRNWDESSTTVYTTLNAVVASGTLQTINAADYNTMYLGALTIQSIPMNEMANGHFIIRPYLTIGDEKVYAENGIGYYINVGASSFVDGGTGEFPVA
ncbi:MAG: hypothetical protein KIG36_07300 [Eubacteriales bacterium]|nr:hypothetical protein [Eubacteriales bacterium]